MHISYIVCMCVCMLVCTYHQLYIVMLAANTKQTNNTIKFSNNGVTLAYNTTTMYIEGLYDPLCHGPLFDAPNSCSEFCAYKRGGGYCWPRYCCLELLDRELFVRFQREDKLEKLGSRNLSSSSNWTIWARKARMEKFDLDEGLQPYPPPSPSVVRSIYRY